MKREITNLKRENEQKTIYKYNPMDIMAWAGLVFFATKDMW